MIRILIVSISPLTVVLLGPAVAGMQHRMGGQVPMGTQPETQEPSSSQHSMMVRGMMGQGMMAMMHPSGVGMMSGQSMDPKTVGRMLQLRADMLKAVGEVLYKHGKELEEAH
jgi:hypothetical protein